MKNLPYYLILFLLRIIVLLPTKSALFIGKLIGRLLYFVLNYRRKIVMDNFNYAFPNLSDLEKKALLKKHFDSVGMGIIEMGFAWFYSEKKLKAISYFECDAESLKILQDKNQGVILLGCHSTLLELGVRLLGLNIHASGMYRPIKNDFFNSWIKQQRERASGSTELVHYKDMRQTLKFLINGNNLWYACDQDMGHESSVFVPFFGLNTATIDILPKLKNKTNAQFIPVYFWRNNNGIYQVKIYPPFANHLEALPLMTLFNQQLEKEIRHYPEQYYWFHRRFKSAPDGTRRVYTPK